VIKDFIVLTKFVLSFAVSLSALLAYVMATGTIGLDAFIATFAVLLVALGVSTINQVQEYKEDAQMERTKNRPVASGKISPLKALVIGAFLIVVSLVLIYDLLGYIGLDLFLLAFLWYNFFYTPLKKKSAFAVVPGAILGVIPPAVGWLAAGHSLYEIEFYGVGIFYFIWQVPHFWLLVMLHYGGYEKAGYPTAMERFGKISLQRMTFVWMIFTIQAGIYMSFIFEIQSMIVVILLVLTGLGTVYSGLPLVKKGFALTDARKVFREFNSLFLLTIILICIDVVVRTHS
jgi:heme o synthase